MRQPNFPCPIEKAQEILGRKWAILLIRDMYVGKSKFSEFLAENPTLSTRILALRLKELEKHEFIEKRIVSTTPLRSEYFLTHKGKATRKIMLALSLFSLEFHPDFTMSQKKKEIFEEALTDYFS